MAQDNERVPVNQRMVDSMQRDQQILLEIPGLLEDLNEAGQEAELIVAGYEWTIMHVGGSIICHSWREAWDMLKDMRAKLTAQYGEPERPE